MRIELRSRITRISSISILLLAPLLIQGCAMIEGGRSGKEETIKVRKVEYDSLAQEKIAMEKKLREAEDRIQAQKAAFEKEKATYIEQIEAGQKEQEAVKIILLFDGKIKYLVDAAASMDYEETIILMMINNPEFKEAMQKKGDEADMALISLLREISPDDRKITKKEILDYRKKIAAKPQEQK